MGLRLTRLDRDFCVVNTRVKYMGPAHVCPCRVGVCNVRLQLAARPVQMPQAYKDFCTVEGLVEERRARSADRTHADLWSRK